MAQSPDAKASIAFTQRRGKPVIEVLDPLLSPREVDEFKSKALDNTTVLTYLAEKYEGLLDRSVVGRLRRQGLALVDSTVEKKRFGRSFTELIRRTSGDGQETEGSKHSPSLQQYVGSGITVIIRHPDKQLSYRAGPPELERLKAVKLKAQEAKRDLERRYTLENKSPKDLQRELGKIDTAITRLDKAYHLVRDKGYSGPEAANARGVKPLGRKMKTSTLGDWLSGARLPVELMNQPVFTPKQKSGKILFPKEESLSFAYFLGAWVSITRVGGRTGPTEQGIIKFHATDDQIAENIRLGMQEAIKEKDVAVGEGRGREAGKKLVQFISQELRRQLMEATDQNSAYPFQQVVTEYETRAFVRGFTDMSMAVGENKIQIQQQGGIPFLEEFAVKLDDLGIQGTLVHGRPDYINIQGPHSIITFRDKIYPTTEDDPICRLFGPPSKELFDKISDAAQRDKIAHTQYQYDAVMRLKKRDNDLSPAEISLILPEELAVGGRIVSAWTRTTDPDVPSAVTRREALQILREAKPDYTRLGELYREGGFSVPEIRALARMEQEINTASQNDEPGINPSIDAAVTGITRNWDAWQRAPEVARNLIGFIAERYPEGVQRAHLGFLARLSDDETGRGLYRQAVKELDVEANMGAPTSRPNLEDSRDNEPVVDKPTHNGPLAKPKPILGEQLTHPNPRTFVRPYTPPQAPIVNPIRDEPVVEEPVAEKIDPITEHLMPVFEKIKNPVKREGVRSAMRELNDRHHRDWITRIASAMSGISEAYRVQTLLEVSAQMNAAAAKSPPRESVLDEYNSSFTKAANLLISAMERNDLDKIFANTL